MQATQTDPSVKSNRHIIKLVWDNTFINCCFPVGSVAVGFNQQKFKVLIEIQVLELHSLWLASRLGLTSEHSSCVRKLFMVNDILPD